MTTETNTDILNGLRVLIVDDEPDVLETLQDLLPMCHTTCAGSFEEAREALEKQEFDLAILDIMGVSGYELLSICRRKGIPAVMLTARALSADDVKKSFTEGAAYFLPKEEMVNIASFLAEIMSARAAGRNTWSGWYKRLASFCERTFGPDFKKKDSDFWDKITYY